MTALFDFSGTPGQTIAWERSYWLDEQRIADNFGVELSPKLQDLLSIAMAAYVADRRSPRPAAGHGLWRRELAIRVAAHDPGFWAGPETRQQLVDLLGWLTEDSWELDFVKRSPQMTATQQHMFASPPASPVRVALFSGGLDSLAGAAVDLNAGGLGDLVLVAASSNEALRGVQFGLARGLRTLGQVRHVNVPLSLVHKVAGHKDERTQRTRGFLYLVLGSVVSDLAGAEELYVYENGIGALNLAYAESQVGAQSSRSVHPKTLRLASRLLGRVLGRQFTIILPNFELTKGDLCTQMPVAARPLVKSSVSCDGFPSRIPGRPPCGGCTSCLLRRQSLQVAGLAGLEPSGTYRADSGYASATEQARQNLHDMLAQASTIERLSVGADPWAAMTLRFPALTAIDDPDLPPLLREAARRSVLQLLRRYAAEWRAYPTSLAPLYFSTSTHRRLASV